MNEVNKKLDELAKRYDNGEFRGPGEYLAAVTAAITDYNACECNDQGKGQYHLPGCRFYVEPKGVKQ